MDVPDMKSPKIWFNGEIRDAAGVALSPFDNGWLTGDGCFETLMAYRGCPFALDRHFRRLTGAVGRLGFSAPEQDEIRSAIQLVLQANDLEQEERSRIRITGSSGVTIGNSTGNTWTVSALSAPPCSPSASVLILPYCRNEKSALSGLKSISYGENSLALRDVRNQGADEGVFANSQGHLCEGTSTNVFVIHENGELVTPPLSSGCLPGVTRELVIELCLKNDIPILEQTASIDTLRRASAAFLSSSLRGVQAIHSVDGQSIPMDHQKIVARLQAAYRDLVRGFTEGFLLP